MRKFVFDAFGNRSQHTLSTRLPVTPADTSLPNPPEKATTEESAARTTSPKRFPLAGRHRVVPLPFPEQELEVGPDTIFHPDGRTEPYSDHRWAALTREYLLSLGNMTPDISPPVWDERPHWAYVRYQCMRCLFIWQNSDEIRGEAWSQSTKTESSYVRFVSPGVSLRSRESLSPGDLHVSPGKVWELPSVPQRSRYGVFVLRLDGRVTPASATTRSTDRLWFTTPRLSRGSHRVNLQASDAQGLTTTHSWSFKFT
jgi:hypothetical protein